MTRLNKTMLALFAWLSIGLIVTVASGTAYNNGVEVGPAAVQTQSVRVDSTSIGRSTSEYGTIAHDGSDLTITNSKGGIKLKTPAQKAQGTVTMTGLPVADETMVVGTTTITARASGATTDEFNIGATVPSTLANLAAAINAGSEAANVTAWVDSTTTVIVEADTAGTAGNSIVLTEAMTNVAVDGTGTLGATNAGAAAATLIDADHSTGGIQIVPNAGGITKFGGEATGHSLSNDGDVVVYALEANSTAWLDGGFSWGGGSGNNNGMSIATNKHLKLDGFNGAGFAFNTLQETVTIPVGSGLDPVVVTSQNMAPANSLIFGVTARVVDAPGGGATTLDIGITGGDTDVFCDGASTALNTTIDTISNGDGTQLPIMNDAAATLTLTTDADVTGDQMQVRVAVYYAVFTPQQW